MFCGTEHIVKRGGGAIFLKPVVEGLTKVQSGVDKTASELAIVRLRQEIADLDRQIEILDGTHKQDLAILDADLDNVGVTPPLYLEHFVNTSLWRQVLELVIVAPIVILMLGVALSFVNEEAGVYVCFFAPWLALLWYGYGITWGIRSRKQLRQYSIKDAEVKSKHQEYLAQHAALLKEREDKQQQLAKHRDFVSK